MNLLYLSSYQAHMQLYQFKTIRHGSERLTTSNKKAVLSQEEPRDAAVNFET